FFFQAEDGIRDRNVTGVQTCALPISDTVSEDEEPFSNVTVTGDSMQMITKELETRISRPPFFDHLKVLVVSEQVAKEADLFSSEIGRASCRERVCMSDVRGTEKR